MACVTIVPDTSITLFRTNDDRPRARNRVKSFPTEKISGGSVLGGLEGLLRGDGQGVVDGARDAPLFQPPRAPTPRGRREPHRVLVEHMRRPRGPLRYL